MPFEQRNLTYFICKTCKSEYQILPSPTYSQIYKCPNSNCNFQEPFLAINNYQSYNISSKQQSFLTNLLKNSIFQGTVASILAFILIGFISIIISKEFLDKFKKDLIHEIKIEMSQKNGGK